LSFDVWVESTPFDETPQYVQNLLPYSVTSGQNPNSPQPLVVWHARYFDDQKTRAFSRNTHWRRV
ncbi:hypothetical protein, partial [Pseudomonas fluorescens]